MLEISLLGPLEVRSGDARVTVAGGRERAMLAFLTLHRGQTVGTDEILEVLWRDEPLRDPRHALQASMARLRRTLREAGGHDTAIVTQEPGYRLATDTEARVDVDRFERLSADAREVLDADPAAASDDLARALALFRGAPLADFTYEEWAQSEIARLDEARLAALADRIEADLALGRHGQLVAELESLVRDFPFHERFRAQLMLALYRGGRQRAALAAYRDGRRMLVDELGIEPGPELQRLEQAVLRQDPAIGGTTETLATSAAGASHIAEPLRGEVASSPGNLPVPLTSFIGRDADMSEVATSLTERRIVTLVGVGGTGKTRLGIEVARNLRAEFAHGSWFVDLSATREGADVSRAIGAVLEVRETYEIALDRAIADHLGQRRLLLLLDNCEQVVSALAPLVQEWAAAAPGLTVLSTSREPLGVAGEVLWHVQPLPIPDSSMTEEAVVASDAYRLFIERAVLVDPRFEANASKRKDIASICQSVDGIPLAIELAAGQLVGMAIEDIARRLRDRPLALGRGPRTADPRQRTFEAAVDGSYALLAESEQVLFRRLSVFDGGFSLSAAEALGKVVGSEGEDIADLLVNLVRKSMVSHGAGLGSSSRYRMLEPIRQFALERSKGLGESTAMRDRHLDFFAGLAEQAASGLRSSAQSRWLGVIDLEYGNLRAALRWAVERDSGHDAAVIATALGPYWRVRGYLSEGRATSEELLDADPDGDPAVRATQLADLGMLAFFQCDYPETQGRSQEALALLSEEQRDPVTAYALLVGGLGAWKLEGHEAGRALLGRSLDAYQDIGDRWGAGTALAYLGMVLKDEGDLAAAAEQYRQSLQRFREQGDDWGVAFSLSSIGILSLAEGRPDEAEASLAEALALSERIDDQWGSARARMFLSQVSLARGETVTARSSLDEAMDAYRRLGDREDAALCLEGYASLTFLEGDPDQAAIILGASDSLRRSVVPAFSSGNLERVGARQLRNDLAERLGEDAFARLRRHGNMLSWPDALALIASSAPPAAARSARS